MLFRSQEIQRFFTHNAFRLAHDIRDRGMVLELRVGESDIRSRVLGSRRTPYKQHIKVSRQGGALSVAGECDCPMNLNCKHVAAALLETIAVQGPDTTEPVAVEAWFPKLTPAAPGASGAELPREISGWFDELRQARPPRGDDYPADVQKRLFYLLSSSTFGGGAPDLALKLVTTKTLKGGGYSSVVGQFQLDKAFQGEPETFLRPADLKILRAIRPEPYRDWRTSNPFKRDDALQILTEILATGRAFWGDVKGPRLTLGEPRPARIVWRFTQDERSRPFIDAPPGIVALNARPPLYVDPARGLVGIFETGLEPAQAETLLEAPPVPIPHLRILSARMSSAGPAWAAVAPAEPDPPVIVDGPPKAILRLTMGSLPTRRQQYYGVLQREEVPVARLRFRYGEFDVSPSDARAVVVKTREKRLYEIRRDDAREKAALAAVFAAGARLARERRPDVPIEHRDDFEIASEAARWFEFLATEAPKLRQAGVEIEFDKPFPFQVLVADGDIAADIAQGSGIDWLELSVGVDIDGERIDLIEPIARMIERGDHLGPISSASNGADERIFVPLGDGRHVAIGSSRLAPILRAIYEIASGGGAASKGKLRISRAEALGLADLEAEAGAAIKWRGGEALREMGRKLAASGGIPEVRPPAEFTATLRPYQAQGLAWLAFLREVGLGGILADDMGLGKTVQALGLIALEKAAGRLDAPALVVAPTSLMANWRREAEKFAPSLRVLKLQGLDRKQYFESIGEHDIVLTTYPLMARDGEVLASRTWHILFLDEAQTIKNPDAATTRFIRGLDARHRFCLTGTPLENHLGELWSLFAFASPGFLGDRAHFTKFWRTPIEKRGDAERGRLLAKRIRPFVLRRTKAEVAPELPPKTEIVERVELLPSQRDVYESIRVAMHERVRAAIAEKGFARSHIVILDALLKLRQACCDPRLLKLAGAAKAGSAKLERLMELLESLVAEGRKIIVFSQFTSMLALIEVRLAEAGLRFALLTGDTRDREAAIDAFRAPDTPVFLISLKAGGTGLNLTEADTVVLYDPWWNPAVEEQAIDRAHRIGQDKPVFVHKLVAADTIEEKMDVLKEAKRALARGLFDADGAPTLAMTEADLELLLGET